MKKKFRGILTIYLIKTILNNHLLFYNGFLFNGFGMEYFCLYPMSSEGEGVKFYKNVRII